LKLYDIGIINRRKAMKEIQNLDGEWIHLIKEARDLGMSIDEIRAVLQSIMDGKSVTETNGPMGLNVSFT
jgi:DNA-binding transcriptional MerR regulator